jgi:hypothetical protein
MPDKPTTLNRFPLFGFFAYRAALKMKYPEETAKLLGYSTAVLYAIFKAKSQKQKESTEKEPKEMPKEVETAKTGTIEFGGKQFMVIFGKGKQPSKTVVGHEIQTPEEYDPQVEAKFPKGWHDRLAKAFDAYLNPHSADQLNSGDTLFELYRAWRDECKVGFNKVDLEKLVEWLKEHGGRE